MTISVNKHCSGVSLLNLTDELRRGVAFSPKAESQLNIELLCIRNFTLVLLCSHITENKASVTSFNLLDDY